MRRASRRKANACNLRVVFPGATASERDVCHCFGVLAEAVLLTLPGPMLTLAGHCLSQSGQAVAHPGKDGRIEAKLPTHRPLVFYLAVTDEIGAKPKP